MKSEHNVERRSASGGVLCRVQSLDWEQKLDLIQSQVDLEADLMGDGIGWKRNGAGFMYNSKFGFGLIKADLLLRAALKWTNVAPKHVCVVGAKSRWASAVSTRANGLVGSTVCRLTCIRVKRCKSTYWTGASTAQSISWNTFRSTWTWTTPREEISRWCSSHQEVRHLVHSGQCALHRFFPPEGTVSMLLTLRYKDISGLGFRSWNLTSVHFWGENPRGQWRFLVRDPVSEFQLFEVLLSHPMLHFQKNDNNRGRVKSVALVLHGTREPVGCLRYGPRRYSDETLAFRTIDMTPVRPQPLKWPSMSLSMISRRNT